MNRFSLHIILFMMLLAFGNSNAFANESIKLITKTTEYTAGDTITL